MLASRLTQSGGIASLRPGGRSTGRAAATDALGAPGSTVATNGHEPAAPLVRPLVQRWFTRYSRHFTAKHFRAVRTVVEERPAVDPEVPTILFFNHPSWWDPMVAFILAFDILPDRRHYAPIDADALDRYRFLRHLGLFGIRRGSIDGARRFLRVTEALCRRPGTCLWITPQGRFVDPRERPVRFESGLGHLVSRLERVVLQPVALEYPFWSERLPEALSLVGSAIHVERGSSRRPSEWTRELEASLERVQDELATRALGRRSDAFRTIVHGRRGVGGIYDRWRSLRAWLRGERFHPEHEALET